MAEFARTPQLAHMFWLPHLGLFTGARFNELCQLNPQTDILLDEESGLWYLHISAKGDAADGIKKAVKTDTSKRDKPIHPKLIDLGFLAYVEHVRKGRHKQLFPSFPASVGRAAPKAAEWFGQFLRKIGLRDETPGARLVGMHACRSTFLNRAQALMVVSAEFITGHSTLVWWSNLKRHNDRLSKRDGNTRE